MDNKRTNKHRVNVYYCIPFGRGGGWPPSNTTKTSHFRPYWRWTCLPLVKTVFTTIRLCVCGRQPCCGNLWASCFLETGAAQRFRLKARSLKSPVGPLPRYISTVNIVLHCVRDGYQRYFPMASNPTHLTPNNQSHHLVLLLRIYKENI